jgi:alpha-D-xyloside xylohydrolase
MRTLFYQFPEDKTCWEIEGEYMYGDKYLVAPVMYQGQTVRRVYLPAGARWREMEGTAVYDGGTFIQADCPIETMPVFVKQDS